MCIVMIKKPTGKIEDVTKYLSNCMAKNGHGSGYMFNRNGKVHIRKGYWKVKDILADIKEDNIQDHETFVFHARWATHGAETVTNCHPFVITRNKTLFTKGRIACDKAVAHNGIIDITITDKALSDTAHFTANILADKLILSNIGKSEGIDFMIDTMIGWSRLAILHGSGKLQLVGAWSFVGEEGNILASNEDYKTKPYTFGLGRYGNWGTESAYGYDSVDDYIDTYRANKPTVSIHACYECAHFEDMENGEGYCRNSKELVRETDECSSWVDMDKEYVVTLTQNKEEDGNDCAHCLWLDSGECSDNILMENRGCMENFVHAKTTLRVVTPQDNWPKPFATPYGDNDCSNCWAASKAYMGSEVCPNARTGNTCQDIQPITRIKKEDK